VMLYHELKDLGAELMVCLNQKEQLYTDFLERPYLAYASIYFFQVQFSFLFALAFSPWGLLGLLAALVVGKPRRALLRSVTKAQGIYLILLPAGISFLMYTLYFLNVYQYRYLTWTFIALVIIEGMALGNLGALVASKRGGRRSLVVICLLASAMSLSWMSSYRLPKDQFPEAARWINSHTRQGDVIATAGQVGTLSYFTDGTVVDLLGKIDGGVIDLYQNKRMEKFLDNLKVRYLVDSECSLRVMLRRGGAKQYLDRYFERVEQIGERKNPLCIFKRIESQEGR